MKYRIVWQDKATGEVFHGECAYEKRVADDWVARMNKKYPDTSHWVEPVGIPDPEDEIDPDRYYHPDDFFKD